MRKRMFISSEHCHLKTHIIFHTYYQPNLFMQYNYLSGNKVQLSVAWFLTLLLLAVQPLLAQPTLVKDINTSAAGSSLFSPTPEDLIELNGTLYFSAYDPATGRELWKSDGTEAGTVLVKDVNPGTGSSNARELTRVGSEFFFMADNGTTGWDLYKSDGTPQGTVRVKNLPDTPITVIPRFYLTPVDGGLYFVFPDEYGTELWRSDGTEAGTVLVKDINPGAGSADPTNLFALNGTLYFSAYDPATGRELWKSDGTAEGTVLVKDINPGTGNTNSISYLTELNGTLYFATGDGSTNAGLWRSDGTETGTVLVKEFVTRSGASLLIQQITNYKGELYFAANDLISGQELWKSDGTEAGTVLVTDINPGSASSTPFNLTVIGNLLYFTAMNNTVGAELWRTDGTNEGTQLVADANPGQLSSFPQEITGGSGIIYFTAYTGDLGRELYKTDGTQSGTQLVKDINPGVGQGIPEDLVVMNDLLYFSAHTATGNYLFRSDGTEEGTVMVKKPSETSSRTADAYPRNLLNVGGTLFFSANEGTTGNELWKSDGTEAGTVLLKDINPGMGNAVPQFLREINGTLYFSADDGTTGPELWKSDGTEAGTVLVKDINPGANGSSPNGFTEVNGVIYFAAGNVATGVELWKTDGTEAGTVLVKDINLGLYLGGTLLTRNSSPSDLTNFNGTLLFSAVDGSANEELWKSDGTAGGTQLVKDIYPGTGIMYGRPIPNSSSPANLVVFNDLLYFTAVDGTGGRELWRSDGTTSGTFRVADLYPGNAGSDPGSLQIINGSLYFSAFTPDTGRELWKTDGTAEGTVLVKDINPGALSAGPGGFTYLNGVFYFAATDAQGGRELWKSDGTEAGTVLVKDINPGAGSSAVSNLTSVNGTLLFLAQDGATGQELWRSDGTAEGTQRVSDFNASNISTTPITSLTEVNGVLYFTASGGGYGFELWKYDPVNCLFPDVSLAVQGSTVAPGQDATVTVSGTQVGVTYRLGSGNSTLSAAVAGTGENLTFTVPAISLSLGENVFTVVASGCTEAALAQPAVITVEGSTTAGALRLNAGGGSYTTPDGRPFSEDQYATGGSTFAVSAETSIAGTDADELYQTERYGEFTYNLPVSNGTYQVILHFAEIYWGYLSEGSGAGARQFNVDMEGERKLTDYDIFSKAGGAATAVQETFAVSVTDGTLTIDFVKGSADLPKVSAIEVVPAAATTTSAARIAARQPAERSGMEATLYPNPTAERLSVQLTGIPLGAVTATAITDAAGKTYLQNTHRITGKNEFQIRVGSLSPGLYLLRINTGQGPRVLRFVKR